MSQIDKAPDKADSVPMPTAGYPHPGEAKLEDLRSEWAEEDREMEGRKPDLGEVEEDASVL